MAMINHGTAAFYIALRWSQTHYKGNILNLKYYIFIEVTK